MRFVSEPEFRARIQTELMSGIYADVGAVTGPGRSGAIAAVYASHILRVPFIPFGHDVPANLGGLLIIDTAAQSGRTLRKAARRYSDHAWLTVALYSEPPRVMFWYEGRKPQRFRHELRAAA